MTRKSTEIKTINDVSGSITTNNFSIVGTTNEIDVATSAGAGNNPGTVQIGISSNFSGGGGGGSNAVDLFIALQNTGTGDSSPVINANTTTSNTTTEGVAITWLHEITKDSIYTHSTSTNPEHITIGEDGIYFIMYAINIENTGTNRFVPQAFIYKNGNGTTARLNRTMATSYSRGISYDDDMVVSFSGIVEFSANDVIELRVKRNDADQTSAAQVQKDGTSIHIARVSAVGNKAPIIAATGATTLTNAQSGSVVYVTGSGSVTLPASIEKGVQFVVINDTGSSLTPSLNSNTAVISGHGGMTDQTSRTYVAVSNGNVAFIG